MMSKKAHSDLMQEKFAPAKITRLVADWFAHQARDLPWRIQRTPYRVWLAEVMLQQTQVAVVKNYFARFVTRYPTVTDLARASQDDVLALWAGLGFYSRGRNLHKAAQMVVERFAGEFPRNVDDLMKLPGVGSYTAGAIVTFAYNQPTAVVDGNVARVLSRLLADDSCPTTSRGKRRFEAASLVLAQHADQPRVVQEGLIELGALVCKSRQPVCHSCPVRQHCQAFSQGQIEQFPTTAPAIKRTVLPVACALVHTTNSLWLERRDSERLFASQHSSEQKQLFGGVDLFGGLYEPPSCQVPEGVKPESVIRAMLAVRGIRVSRETSFGPPIVIRRLLSHRELVLHGFPIRLHQEDPPGAHWIDRDRLKRMGLSRAVHQLLHHGLPDHLCLQEQSSANAENDPKASLFAPIPQ